MFIYLQSKTQNIAMDGYYRSFSYGVGEKLFTCKRKKNLFKNIFNLKHGIKQAITFQSLIGSSCLSNAKPSSYHIYSKKKFPYSKKTFDNKNTNESERTDSFVPKY